MDQSFLRILFVFIILLTVLSIFPASSEGAPNWQVAVKVESQGGYNRLVLGADNTGTDGFDSIWDSYALLGGTVTAYFSHPEWGLAHAEFHRDIKAHHPDVPVEWPFVVQTTLTGQMFTLTWSMLNVPSNYQVVLLNEMNAEQTDMQLNSSYQFTYTGSTSLKITVTESSSCANLPARVEETSQYFNTLQEAYNAAQDGQTVQSQAVSITGNAQFNANKSVIIKGGYDCDYANITGRTTLEGNVTINNGSVVMENITLSIP